jgi:hypothetical protein
MSKLKVPFSVIQKRVKERQKINAFAESIGTDPRDWSSYETLTEMLEFVENFTNAGNEAFTKHVGSKDKLIESIKTARAIK